MQHVDLGVLIEIDQNVSAPDNVERSQRGEVREQIGAAKLDHAAQIRGDLPRLADLHEIFNEESDRQPALHFECTSRAALY